MKRKQYLFQKFLSKSIYAILKYFVKEFG